MVLGNVFWGLLLVFAGLSLVFDNVFHTLLPLMKFLLAIVLVYKGLSLLFGHNKPHYRMHE